jgi:carotenoid cleavage dioxygenase-like enzyme
MLHAVSLRDGQVAYRNRWVQTAGLAAENEAGSALYTGLMESAKENPRGVYKDTSNTDVIFDGKELLSLWYIAGHAHRVNALTLETAGPATFGKAKTAKVSAHAKFDGASGEVLFFDNGPRAPFMSYGVVKDGALAHYTDIALEGPRLPHDMAFTERHSILMDLPVHFRKGALEERRWIIDYHRDIPARFGVLPRYANGEAVQWFEAEPCYIYHVVNAWDEGDTTVMIACRCDDPIPALDPNDGELARALANLRLKAHLHEWRFDRKTGKTTERPLDDRSTEFPSIDSRRGGRPSRYAYNMAIPDARTLVFDGLVKYDLERGTSQSYAFGDGMFGSEAPFAPRIGGVEEDDGYVLSFVHDARSDRSALWIFDAKEIARGPLCKVPMSQRVPMGFHACWVDGTRLG